MTLDISPAEQAATDPLEKLATEFQQWRSQKKNPADSIPLSLLQEAQRLTQYYKITTLRKRLGITKAQMDKFNAMEKTPSTAPEFMTLIPHASEETPLSKELKIKIDTPQGITITLSGLTEKNPLGVIAKLLEV